MQRDRDSISNTLIVAGALCLLCSFLVSSVAVALRSPQENNRRRFKQRKVLEVAGIVGSDESVDVDEVFKQVESRVVDLDSGKYAEIDADGFDAEAAIRSGQPIADDIASIGKREQLAVVYEKRTGNKLELVMLPIRGYGLWSTVYGYVALNVKELDKGPEHVSISGITYYKHGETPGLGGEVENPLWTNKWKGKKVFDADWNVKIEVTKAAAGEYQVDAISGATITSDGVTNMLAYWLGQQGGFGKFLKNL